MKVAWGYPFLYRPSSKYGILLEIGGPGENTSLSISTLVNGYLNTYNYKEMLVEVTRYSAFLVMQIKPKLDKIIHGRSPKKSRLLIQNLNHWILTIENRVSISRLPLLSLLLNKNLNQFSIRPGGYFGSANSY